LFLLLSACVLKGLCAQAATLEKLLEFLMQSTGSLALDTFLISYRNFASPQVCDQLL
jgi:hypothetical protein